MLEQESVVERVPLYILVYTISFVPDLAAVRSVSRKWASAVQQLDLLNANLDFDSAECINHYLYPLFCRMKDLAPYPMLFNSVVDQCTKVVERWTDANMDAAQKATKTGVGLRHFVYENCKIFQREHVTNWTNESQYHFPWFSQTMEDMKDDSSASSDFDDDPDVQDDGFRYYADEEEEDDDSFVPRHKGRGGHGEEGNVGYYMNVYPDESASEIARVRSEMGYLNLHTRTWY